VNNTAATETLEALTNKTDNCDLHKFLLECTPEERRSLAPTAIKLYRRAVKGGIKMRSDKSFGYETPEHILGSVTTAVFCTASKEEIESLSFNWMAIKELNRLILWKIKPPSLECLAEAFLNASLRNIYEVRRMIKENLIPPCDAEVYTIALIGCSGTIAESLYEWLLKNDDVLKTGLWRFFEVEGTQENNLAAVDKYAGRGNKWADTLVELSKDGHLPRQRLLSESLSALGRPFIQFRAGWFSRFHESLNPTIEERVELLEEYGKLLGSPIGPTVSFALKAWQTIDQKHPIPVSSIKTHLPPALLSESKATVTGAISILQKAVKRDSAFALEAQLMAVEALQHESADVQEKVLDFLEKSHAGENIAVKDKISARADTVAPSVSKRLEKFLKPVKQAGSSRESNVSAFADAPKIKKDFDIAAAQYRRTNHSLPGWPFACAQTVEPIADIDELIDRAALCLENHAEVLEIERVFDGISRIDTTSRADFNALSKPLLKRAEKLIEDRRWKSLCHQIYMKSLTAWLTHDESKLGADPRWKLPIELLLFNRMRHTLSRLEEGIFLPTLALPEHPSGWLTAESLIERCKIWKDAQVPVDDYDLAFCLHRLPEQECKKILEAKNIDRALQVPFCMAANVKKRLYNGIDDQEEFLNPSVFTMSYPKDESDLLSFIASSAAAFELEKRKWKTRNDATFIRFYDVDIIRWYAISFPGLRENFLELGTRCATVCINYMDVPSRSVRGFLEVLCESGAPIVHNANKLAAAGLMLGDPELSGVNIDALVLAITEQRLEPNVLGLAVSKLLHSSDGKPKRLAHSLGEIARVSPLHAQAVLQILEFTLQGEHAETHKELWAILDTYNELLIANLGKITNPKTAEYLSALSTSGKTGKLAKSLLTLCVPGALEGID